MSAINPAAAQVMARVVSNKKVGAYHHIVLDAGAIAHKTKPGNFVAVSVGGENSNMVLRRAFAIYRASEPGSHDGFLELIVSPHGAGSRWLCAREVNEQLDVIAPLGTAFGIPVEPVNAILIGGGYGSAPLFGLASILKKRGCRVDMILGASTAMKIFAPMEGKRSVNSLTITTDDGSAGVKGKITDVLPSIIEANRGEIVYSCGPMKMLEAITRITVQKDVHHQCSIEESMACGIGVCMTCVAPTRGKDGIFRMERTCISGPVVNGEDVNWNSDRKIPEGVFGYDLF